MTKEEIDKGLALLQFLLDKLGCEAEQEEGEYEAASKIVVFVAEHPEILK